LKRKPDKIAIRNLVGILACTVFIATHGKENSKPGQRFIIGHARAILIGATWPG
jgi:hypothetical protein